MGKNHLRPLIPHFLLVEMPFPHVCDSVILKKVHGIGQISLGHMSNTINTQSFIYKCHKNISLFDKTRHVILKKVHGIGQISLGHMSNTINTQSFIYKCHKNISLFDKTRQIPPDSLSCMMGKSPAHFYRCALT